MFCPGPSFSSSPLCTYLPFGISTIEKVLNYSLTGWRYFIWDQVPDISPTSLEFQVSKTTNLQLECLERGSKRQNYGLSWWYLFKAIALLLSWILLTPGADQKQNKQCCGHSTDAFFNTKLVGSCFEGNIEQGIWGKKELVYPYVIIFFLIKSLRDPCEEGALLTSQQQPGTFLGKAVETTVLLLLWGPHA